jgi:hypothetical protein
VSGTPAHQPTMWLPSTTDDQALMEARGCNVGNVLSGRCANPAAGVREAVDDSGQLVATMFLVACDSLRPSASRS